MPGSWAEPLTRETIDHMRCPMVISAQVSLNPLRQDHLSPAIQGVSETLTAAGLHPQIGPMSTLVMGEAVTVFAALQEAFVRAAALGAVVMTVTVSNACPVREDPTRVVDPV
jgi:uncharacterized protein YqgV (UPF0045/DUF77 family)